MANPLRVGVVGSGFMAVVHARAALRAGADLVGVVTRSGDQSVAGRLGATRAVRRLADLVHDVDVVHVCTPNLLHEAQVLEALDAGCHVVCEKPLATTLDGAAMLHRAAEASGRVALIPFVYRFYGAVRHMREMVQAGGQISRVRANYLQDWMADPNMSNWRADGIGGGPSRAFGDIGVHVVDLAEFVTGQRIVRLAAQVKTIFATRPGIVGTVQNEDIAAMLFETDQGVLGEVVASQVSWGRPNCIELEVDARDAAWSFSSRDPELLWSASRDGIHLLPRGRSQLSAARRYDRLPAGHPQGYQDCFDAFVADAYATIKGESPDGLPTFADGVRAAMVTQAVLESARASTWVAVG